MIGCLTEIKTRNNTEQNNFTFSIVSSFAIAHSFTIFANFMGVTETKQAKVKCWGRFSLFAWLLKWHSLQFWAGSRCFIEQKLGTETGQWFRVHFVHKTSEWVEKRTDTHVESLYGVFKRGVVIGPTAVERALLSIGGAPKCSQQFGCFVLPPFSCSCHREKNWNWKRINSNLKRTNNYVYLCSQVSIIYSFFSSTSVGGQSILILHWISCPSKKFKV